MPAKKLNFYSLFAARYKIGNRRSNQRGVALIVVLIFIVALTSLAIYSAKDVSLGERVARNQLDAQVAREAAEAALRDAEFDLLLPNGNLRTGAYCARDNITERPINTNQAASSFSATCIRGQCSIPLSVLSSSNYNAAATATNYEPWWPPSKGGLWNDDLTTKPTTASSAKCAGFAGSVPFGAFTGRAPIAGVSRQPEYLIEKITLDFVRITARGFGRNPNTEVVLQSYFRPFQ